MSVRHESWPEGTPAWVDLVVPDRHAAQSFYGQLFGWEFSEGSEDTGFYTMCLKGSEPVAGLVETPAGQPPQAPAWTTYLAVDDVQESVQKVRQAGGQVLMEPMQVMDFGHMALAADPVGAVFGMWQSGTHTGANLVDEPGAVTWNEVISSDFERAKGFYREVFDYTYGDMSGEGFSYATLLLGDQPVGGIGGEGTVAPGVQPHWMTYFKVDDTDAAVSQVRQLGGTLVREAWDTEFGRMAVVHGPSGEMFSLMADVREGS